jgi:hypothetical protein
MSEPSSLQEKDQLTASKDAQPKSEEVTPNSGNGIEDLLRQLHGQIKTSDWLEKNTANSFQEQNPDLVKAWKDAINSESNS